MSHKEKRPKEILVNVELNPGPKQRRITDFRSSSPFWHRSYSKKKQHFSHYRLSTNSMKQNRALLREAKEGRILKRLFYKVIARNRAIFNEKTEEVQRLNEKEKAYLAQLEEKEKQIKKLKQEKKEEIKSISKENETKIKKLQQEIEVLSKRPLCRHGEQCRTCREPPVKISKEVKKEVKKLMKQARKDNEKKFAKVMKKQPKHYKRVSKKQKTNVTYTPDVPPTDEINLDDSHHLGDGTFAIDACLPQSVCGYFVNSIHKLAGVEPARFSEKEGVMMHPENSKNAFLPDGEVPNVNEHRGRVYPCMHTLPEYEYFRAICEKILTHVYCRHAPYRKLGAVAITHMLSNFYSFCKTVKLKVRHKDEADGEDKISYPIISFSFGYTATLRVEAIGNSSFSFIFYLSYLCD